MIQVLYKKNEKPAAIWVTDRQPSVASTQDQDLLMAIVTGHRVHSWTNVMLGEVELRTISATMPPPIQASGIERGVLTPFRDEDMVYPPGDRSFWSAYHIVADPENDGLWDVNAKFLRPGLWFSPTVAGGTIVGHQNRIYVIPDGEIGRFAKRLKMEGATAFSGFDSFDDATVVYTDAQGVISETILPETNDRMAPDIVIQSVRQGAPIGAIKELMKATGLGLKEAEDIVDNVARSLRDEAESTSKTPSCSAEQDLDGVLALLRAGEKIRAVKFYRERTGYGLKESLDAVDAIARAHNITVAADSKSGCFIATACYGSPDQSQVLVLRAFRDDVLLNSGWGKRFVWAYYRLSPRVAVWLTARPIWRSIFRRFLMDPVVGLLTVYKSKAE